MPRKERVPRAIDGDTFMTDSRKSLVRLANVNAPQKGSREAALATRTLRTLIQGQTVSIDTVHATSTVAAMANVKVGNCSVNEAMRRKGYT